MSLKSKEGRGHLETRPFGRPGSIRRCWQQIPASSLHAGRLCNRRLEGILPGARKIIFLTVAKFQEGQSEGQGQRQDLQNSRPELQPLPLEPDRDGWGSWELGRAYFPFGEGLCQGLLGWSLASTVDCLGVRKWRHVHYGLIRLFSHPLTTNPEQEDQQPSAARRPGLSGSLPCSLRCPGRLVSWRPGLPYWALERQSLGLRPPRDPAVSGLSVACC